MGSSSRISVGAGADDRRHVHARPLAGAEPGRPAGRSRRCRAGSARAACAPRPRAGRLRPEPVEQPALAAASASAAAGATAARTSTSPAVRREARRPAGAAACSCRRRWGRRARRGHRRGASGRRPSNTPSTVTPRSAATSRPPFSSLVESHLERGRVARRAQPVLGVHLAPQPVLARLGLLRHLLGVALELVGAMAAARVRSRVARPGGASWRCRPRAGGGACPAPRRPARAVRAGARAPRDRPCSRPRTPRGRRAESS